MLRDDSKAKLDAIIDDSTSLPTLNAAAADVEPGINLPNVQSLNNVFKEYQKFDNLIDALRNRSSYNKITVAEVAAAIGGVFAWGAFMLACNVGTAAAIYFMNQNNRFHANKKYSHKIAPGTNLTCGELLPDHDDLYTDDAANPILSYCADEYVNLWWLAAAMYGSAIILSSCSIFLSIASLVGIVNAIDDCGRKMTAKVDKLPIKLLKNSYKKELYERCISSGVLVEPRDLGVSVSDILSNCLPNRHQFFNFVELAKASDSHLSRLPNEISLVVAAYADLLDKKTRGTVIKNAFIDRLPKAEKSAFYAADESAEDFDIPLTSAAAAASPLSINSDANERTPLRSGRW